MLLISYNALFVVNILNVLLAVGYIESETQNDAFEGFYLGVTDVNNRNFDKLENYKTSILNVNKTPLIQISECFGTVTEVTDLLQDVIDAYERGDRVYYFY